MTQPGNNSFSRVTFWLCMLMMCYTSFFFYPRWQHRGSEATISWDVSGYYWYLPSVFIYKDLKHQSFKDSVFKKYAVTNGDFQQAKQVDNGNYVMKYSSGMAVMYLPFFTAAHLLAGVLGYPRDGFSHPYQFAIQFGGLLISVIGLWFFRKLLLLFYRDKVVAVTLAILVFGTNYLNFSTVDCGMSHCWLFTVYVFLILNTHYFYSSFKLKYALRIGLLAGLATLTRPTDILCCIIPLLWGMESISLTAIKNRAALVAQHYKALLIAGICAAIVISIQVIYWRYASGHWIVYSYEGQHLYFRSPNFMDYTFSYRSGWLVYSPMLVFAFIGIIPFLRNGKNKVAILSFFLLNYYIVCAWSIWWYGGRAMIQSYPVLFFCIASLADAAMSRKLLLWILAPIAVVFIYFNLWITYAYHKGNMYDTDCMTKAFFWKVAGRWSVPQSIEVLKDNPDLFEGTPKDPQVLYENNFSTDTGSTYVASINGQGKTLLLNKEHQGSPFYKFAFTGTNAQWLRAQATVHCNTPEYDRWKMAQFIVRLKYKDNIVKESMIRVYRLLDEGEIKTISIDMKLPAVTYDSVNIFFWNADSDKPLWINDLKATAFHE